MTNDDGKRHFAWFGGQGSTEIFDAKACQSLAQKTKGNPPAAYFLRRCREAFAQEIEELGSLEFQAMFSQPAPDYRDDESLLAVHQDYHSNPVVQSTTFTLHQILSFITRVPPQQLLSQDTTEYAGFCSGMLAAAVAASAVELDDVVRLGVEAFRLSFWIAYRTTKFSQRLETTGATRLPCLLVVSKITDRQVHEILSDENSKDESVQKIRVAAHSQTSTFSFTGPNSSLERLRNAYGGHYAHVHSIYHGSEAMSEVVDETIADVHRRNILFPRSQDLRTTLRDARTGQDMRVTSSPESSLLSEVLTQILVDPVEWVKVVEATIETLDLRDATEQSRYVFESYGSASAYLFKHLKKRVPLPAITIVERREDFHSSPPSHSDADVAVVGMSINLPGANNVDQFWDNISTARRSDSKFPRSRSDGASGTSMPDSNDWHGYYLNDIYGFDHAFFNMSPREASSMDPQQKLLLHAAKEALEDAGCVPDSTATSDRATFGCYVGVATGDYEENLRDDIDVYYSTGTLRAFLSGKLSYAFGFGGPSIVIDTACSSSTVSIHEACRSLRIGDCRAALAGGVNIISAPSMYSGLARAHFLSPEGTCKPFDEGADGYGRAEGCVMFVLKRLKDALAEGDPIHAIIKGSGINQCGQAKSITHPDWRAQSSLFRQVLDNAAISPSTIDVVEAHGTGTQAGDTAEIASISAVYSGFKSSAHPLYISSIKGNIGHCEAASGAAGLAKVILMMRHGTIPQQAALSTTNKKFKSQLGSNLVVPLKSFPWGKTSPSRRAMVNNFGAAGSNCAIIVEEPPQTASKKSLGARQSFFPFILSAKTEQSLKQLALFCARSIATLPDEVTLADICYSSCARRQPHPTKLSLVCQSREDLIEQLKKSTCSTAPSGKDMIHKVVFVFSGQGSLHFGMGGGPEFLQHPVVASVMERCDRFLQSLGVFGMQEYFKEPQSEEDIADAEHAVHSQCACVAMEFAIAQLLSTWNIRPYLVMGHSLGEYSALAFSGILTIEDTLGIVVHRAQLMKAHCTANKSGMLACQTSPERASSIIQEKLSSCKLDVSCHNSPKDVVVSGDLESLAKFRDACASESIKSKQLAVPFGFHSEFMDPIKEPLDAYCASVPRGTAKIPILLNASEDPADLTSLEGDYFSHHTRTPVNFSAMMDRVVDDPKFAATAFVDIGPHPTTLPLARANTAGRVPSVSFIPTTQKGVAFWQSISQLLIKLGDVNVDINWRQVFASANASFVRLPGHPLQLEHHFKPPFTMTEPRQKGTDTSGARQEQYQLTGGALLPARLSTKPNELLPSNTTFYTSMRILQRFIEGHKVNGIAICPASVFCELFYEAAADCLGSQPNLELYIEDMSFHSPLMSANSAESADTRVSLESTTVVPGRQVQCEVKSADDQRRTTFCRARVARSQDRREPWHKIPLQASNFEAQLRSGSASSTFSTDILYKSVFTRVVDYADMYHVIQNLSIDTDTLQGLGTFEIPSAPHESFMINPIFLDTLFHAAGFIANVCVGGEDICICAHAESVTCLRENISQTRTFKIFCSLQKNDNDGVFIADSYAIDVHGKVVAAVQGMAFKKLKLTTFRSHLDRAARAKSSPPHTHDAVQKVAERQVVAREPKHQVIQQPSQSRGDLKKNVIDAIADTCGRSADSIDPTCTLDHLGVDSLMLQEIGSTLQERIRGLTTSQLGIDPSQTMNQVIDQVGALATPFDDSSSNTTSAQESGDEGSATKSGNTTASQTPPTGSTTPEDPEALHSELQLLEHLSQTSGLDVESIKPETTLEKLGIDSLLKLELIASLRKSFPGANLGDEDSAEASNTVRDLINTCLPAPRVHASSSKMPREEASAAGMSTQSAAARGSVSPSSPFSDDQFLTVYQDCRSDKSPLLVVHDGSGLGLPYAKLQVDDRKLGAISSPWFSSPERIPHTVPDMADEYLKRLSSHHQQTIFAGEKGVILAGWSFGGAVAYEMALRAIRYGIHVKGLLLIDTPYPVNHRPLPQQIISYISRASDTTNGAKSPSSETGSNTTRHLKVQAQFTANAGMLSDYRRPQSSISCPVVILVCQDNFDALRLCGVNYPWLSEREARDEAVQRWLALLGRDDTRILELCGHHFEPFKAGNVGVTSRQIQQACEILGG